MGHPKLLRQRKSDLRAVRLFPRTEARAAVAEIFHVVGVTRVEAGQGCDFPRYFSSVVQLDDVGNREHLVEIPPADRLKSPDQLLAQLQIAVVRPEETLVPTRPPVGMSKRLPQRL